MRGFIVMAMFAVSLSHAESNGFSETRNLELDAAGLSELFIDAGAGSVTIDDVDHDLVIEEEGSGSLRYTNVRGDIRRRD